MHSPLVVIVIVIAFSEGTLSLRDAKLSVPEGVKVGQPVTLNCFFQLEGDNLYSLKWYKDGNEFYRYTPKEKPPLKIFSTYGNWEDVIDKDKSNGTQLTLKRMEEGMGGLYVCEASAESPSFQTVTASATIVVVEPPQGKITISGLKSKYEWDDVIQANCTAPGSKPAANITWSINYRIADQKHVTERRRILNNDLEQTISTIKIHARPHNFVGGRLRLRCAASVYQIYWETAERIVDLTSHSLQNTPQFGGGNSNEDLPGWRPSYKETPERGKHTPLHPTESFRADEKGEVLEKIGNDNSSICSPPTTFLHLLLFTAFAFSF